MIAPYCIGIIAHYASTSLLSSKVVGPFRIFLGIERSETEYHDFESMGRWLDFGIMKPMMCFKFLRKWL